MNRKKLMISIVLWSSRCLTFCTTILTSCLCLFLVQVQAIEYSQMPHRMQTLGIKADPIHFKELGLYLHVDVSAEVYVENRNWRITAPELFLCNTFQLCSSLKVDVVPLLLSEMCVLQHVVTGSFASCLLFSFSSIKITT